MKYERITVRVNSLTDLEDGLIDYSTYRYVGHVSWAGYCVVLIFEREVPADIGRDLLLEQHEEHPMLVQ